MKSSVFLDITTCSLLKSNWRFRGTCRLPLHVRRMSGARKQSKGSSALPPPLTLVSCSAHSLTLKMEATCYSETSVNFWQTTQHYIPEDRTSSYFHIFTSGWWMRSYGPTLQMFMRCFLWEVLGCSPASYLTTCTEYTSHTHMCILSLSYLMIEIAGLYCHLYLLY
jgi:hypothetical protein